MKIFIDPGHGGTDSGATSGNLIEKNMALICAYAVKDYLDKQGMDTKLSRSDDTQLSLTKRAAKANHWGADLFVSCHFNAGGGDRGETIHSVFAGKGKELAEKIAGQLKAIGQQTVRVYSKIASSGYGDYYTVIAETNMPAVIVEPCFIDSPDREFADTEEEQKAVGIAIAKGVLDYLGLHDKENENMQELTEPNDIVWEYAHRGIVTDADGMLWEMKNKPDGRLYWLARKALHYMRRRGI